MTQLWCARAGSSARFLRGDAVEWAAESINAEGAARTLQRTPLLAIINRATCA